MASRTNASRPEIIIGGFPIRGERAREMGWRQAAVKETSAEYKEPASTAYT